MQDALLEKVFTEASLVACIFAYLWWLERGDRRRAEVDRNEQHKETIVALNSVTNVLEVVRDKLK
jgi:hypothetical protein